MLTHFWGRNAASARDSGLIRVTIRPGFLFLGLCPGRFFENRRFVRVFGPIRKYTPTLPIANTYDGTRQRKLVFQYKMSVTSQNAIFYKLRVHVYWTKVSDVHITNDLKWFCIVSMDPRLVIFLLTSMRKSVLFFRLRQYGNPKPMLHT